MIKPMTVATITISKYPDRNEVGSVLGVALDVVDEGSEVAVFMDVVDFSVCPSTRDSDGVAVGFLGGASPELGVVFDIVDERREAVVVVVTVVGSRLR